MKTYAPEIPYNDQMGSANLPLRLKLFRFVGKQTWIPRGQDRLLRMIWPPDGKRSFSFEVNCLGARWPGDLAELIDWHVFAYGSFSRKELDLLAELGKELRKSRSTLTFFDVGGNVGNHSLFMSQHADQVIAFEPLPALQEKIRQKIAINQRTNIRLIPCALGDEDTVQRYFPGGGGNSGSGTFIPESFETYKPPIEIEISHGERLFDKLDLPRIDIMKIDVEGFESKVFRGLAARIRRDRPPILTEMGERCRQGFGSEQAFRTAFYEGAIFFEVRGRYGRTFHLKPFDYERSNEAVILPPELAGWAAQHLQP